MKSGKWCDDEINFVIKNYEKRGVKYVASNLDRTTSSVQILANRRLGITSQVEYNFVNKDFLIEKMKISHSYSELLRNLNKVINGTNLKLLKEYIIKYEIPNDIFILKIDRTKRIKIDIKQLLQNGTKIGSSKLKEKLYKEGLKERKCEKCGLGENWNGEHMSLILDHINGINDDNRLENLKIVCPNCNATLDTHCRGYKRINDKLINDYKKIEYKKGKEKRINDGHLKQRKVQRPPYKQLIEEIKQLGYSGTGRKYGVSDNAIRKWIKIYEKY